MESTVFLGTFVGGPGGGMRLDGPPSESAGIYSARFDPSTGLLHSLAVAAACEVSPSWFRWHPTLPVLYANEETFGLPVAGDLVCPNVNNATAPSSHAELPDLPREALLYSALALPRPHTSTLVAVSNQSVH